jgi:hypothetical protein
VQKPVIYGDEGRFRAAVTKAINSGQDLLAQIEGVRKLMQVAGDPLEARGIESGWEAESGPGSTEPARPCTGTSVSS